MLFGKRMHPFRKKHVCSFKTRKTYENRNEHITRRTTLPHPCLRIAGTGHALLPQLRAPLGQRAAEAVDYAQSRAPLPPPRGRVLPRAADTYAEAGEGGGGRVGCAVLISVLLMTVRTQFDLGRNRIGPNIHSRICFYP